MDFSAVERQARTFVDSNRSSGLQVVKADEEQGQIFFYSAENNFEFFVTCPSEESSGWNVWSDKPESIDVITSIMDRLKLDSNDISTVLEAIIKCLRSESCMKFVHACKAQNSSVAFGNDYKQDEDDFEDEGADDDDDDDFENYYGGEDFDAEADVAQTNKIYEREEEEKMGASFFTGQGSQAAVKRLVKDLKALNDTNTNLGITASPRGSNNLFVWDVKIMDVPKKTKLGRDLAEYAQKYGEEPVIQMDMQFPPDYPFSPPFIRVIKPRFKFLTGHVTIGGSICMQMLTTSGWRPTNDIESILVQVRAEILSDPNASLDPRPDRCYSETEARDAFKRMVAKYGW